MRVLRESPENVSSDELWERVCKGEDEDIEFIREYVQNGGDLDVRYHKFGREHSLLLGAIRNRNVDMADLLLRLGATPTVEEGRDLAMYAIDNYKNERRKYYNAK